MDALLLQLDTTLPRTTSESMQSPSQPGGLALELEDFSLSLMACLRAKRKGDNSILHG